MRPPSPTAARQRPRPRTGRTWRRSRSTRRSSDRHCRPSFARRRPPRSPLEEAAPHRGRAGLARGRRRQTRRLAGRSSATPRPRPIRISRAAGPGGGRRCRDDGLDRGRRRRSGGAGCARGRPRCAPPATPRPAAPARVAPRRPENRRVEEFARWAARRSARAPRRRRQLPAHRMIRCSASPASPSASRAASRRSRCPPRADERGRHRGTSLDLQLDVRRRWGRRSPARRRSDVRPPTKPRPRSAPLALSVT